VSRQRARAELLEEIESLRPWQELAFSLLRGETGERFDDGREDGDARLEVTLYGAARACGGVVVLRGGSAEYAERWCARAQRSADPYVQSVANQVMRRVVEAVRERVGVYPRPAAPALAKLAETLPSEIRESLDAGHAVYIETTSSLPELAAASGAPVGYLAKLARDVAPGDVLRGPLNADGSQCADAPIVRVRHEKGVVQLTYWMDAEAPPMQRKLRSTVHEKDAVVEVASSSLRGHATHSSASAAARGAIEEGTTSAGYVATLARDVVAGDVLLGPLDAAGVRLPDQLVERVRQSRGVVEITSRVDITRPRVTEYDKTEVLQVRGATRRGGS